MIKGHDLKVGQVFDNQSGTLSIISKVSSEKVHVFTVKGGNYTVRKTSTLNYSFHADMNVDDFLDLIPKKVIKHLDFQDKKTYQRLVKISEKGQKTSKILLLL